MILINRFFKKLTSFEGSGFAWLCYLFVFSLFFSRAGLAISGVLLLVYAVIHYFKSPFKASLNPIHYVFFGIYTIYTISVFATSENIAYGFHLLFKNAVFIILPIAFIFSKNLTEKATRRVFLLVLFFTVICITINTVEALLHFSQFLEDIANSKNIIPILGPSHSELGVLSAVAFVLGIYLANNITNQKIKLSLFLLLGFLFFELHIIAYRFSLTAIYTVILLYIGSELIQKKNFKLFFLTIVIFLASIYLLSLTPPLKNRIQNTIDDLTTITEKRNPNFQSITQRLLAINCAVEIIKENPWFGVSPANTSLKMQQQYVKNSYLLIPENRMFIHNQYVYYVLSFGIPLGLLICFALVFLIIKNWRANPLIFWVMIPFLFHMMIENTLERQITANAFIFLFLVINCKHKKLIQ